MIYKDYSGLGFTKLDETAFKAVSIDSEVLIENVTNDFYVFHNIAKDLTSDDEFDVYRAKQYQKAIALQCEFADETGASTPYPQHLQDVTQVSIDRTSITQNGNPITSTTYGNSGVVNAAIDVLVRTGLLYRGVNSH